MKLQRFVLDPSMLSHCHYMLLILLLAAASRVSAFAPSPLNFNALLPPRLVGNSNHPPHLRARIQRPVNLHDKARRAPKNAVADDEGGILSEETLDAPADDARNTSTGVTSLEALGWQPHFAEQLVELGITLDDDDDNDDDNDEPTERLFPVRVVEVRGKGLHILGPGIDKLLPPTGKRPAVGDWILIDQDHRRSGGVLKRTSLIKRKAPGRGQTKTQLIAANLDTAFVVSSCNQDFNVARLERYVAIALEAGVEPVIVLTKRDLCAPEDDGEEEDDDEFDGDIDEFEEKEEDNDNDDDAFDDGDGGMAWLLDYYAEEASVIAGGTVPVVCLDARGDEPSQKLAPWIQPGQTVAFLGSSGVGKSTLVNSLFGSQVAATGAIHVDSGQGRHTTTRRQLHFLDNGCAVMDTPGLREIQLIDASYGVSEVFADLVEIAKGCRFNDCKHDVEPGCAIAKAVEEELIDVERLARWEKLVTEDLENSKTGIEGQRNRARKSNTRPSVGEGIRQSKKLKKK